MNPAEARAILAGAECICAEAEVEAHIRRLARDIDAALGERFPLVLAVMGGAIVFAGRLLTHLSFPLEFDYLHVTRYRGTQGGALEWRSRPRTPIAGRAVLVLDDILDEGETMAAIREHVLAEGATSFHSAVLADKAIARPKPIHADFVGLSVPDRYVFGCGMDIHGLWRNLPGIYAPKT
jgi:hypoxanthine phosphoribosyltransferase